MVDEPPGVDRTRLVAGVLVAVALVVLLAVRLTADGQEQASVGPAGDARPPGSPARPVVTPEEPAVADVPPAALGGIRFTDVTRQAGLFVDGGATSEPTAADMDAGAAVADLDADGDLDLLLTSSGPASGLHRNDGGVFADVTDASGLPRLASATTATFADVDADGDLDLFLGGPVPELGSLWINVGGLRFVDRSREWGVVGRLPGQRAVRGSDFGDVDRDGDLDLVVVDWNVGSVIAVDVANRDAPDRVTGQCQYAAAVRRLHAAGSLEVTGETRAFRNEGDRFVDATEEWGLAGLGIERPFTPQLVDLDGDGWLDLAVAGDSCSSRLYRNQRGAGFEDVTQQAAVGTDENGMGSLVRDLDGDARPDWLVTSIAYPTADGACPPVGPFAGCSGNRVYLNRGRMRFEDVTDEWGLRNTGWGWGVVAADFGNDGRLQVAVTNGRIGKDRPDPTNQVDVYYDAFVDDPTSFWVPVEGGSYVEAAAQVGITDRSVSHALVAFDHDRDGRLDLLVVNAGTSPTLYRNETPARGWLGIRLEDPSTPGNRGGLGARVDVTTTDGRTTTQWLHTSGSYQSQHPAELHVGLGDAGVERIRVWWPGESRPQVQTGVIANRVVTIARKR